MKYRNLLFCLFLMVAICAFSACGNVEGEYIQLSGFDNSQTNSSTVEDTASNSVTSDETQSSTDVTNEFKVKNEELVRVSDYIPDAKIDIKYATADNFTQGKIYDFDDAYLRYGTVMKLKKAADALRDQGYYLVIWDCYRPQSAQFTLFENAPDPTYVTDPNNGFSSHSSGATIDVSLIKTDGSAVEMPSGFDEFSDKADRNYDDVSESAAQNSKILEKAMQDAGFRGYSAEWWHYSDNDSYEYDDIKNVKLASKSKKSFFADCEEYINLRLEPSTDSEIICEIPADAEMVPCCWIGGFVGVKYGENYGYVSQSFIK